MKRIFQLLLTGIPALLLNIADAAVPGNVQYVFPGDRATLVSRNTNIIIRPGFELNNALQTGDVTVTGSKSGAHTGRIVLARDRKNLIFYPDKAFDAGEQVTVRVLSDMAGPAGERVDPFQFGFRTTPLERPVNAREFPSFFGDLPGADRAAAMKTDELPSFTVTVTGETAPGNLFLAPTQFFTADGFLLMTNDQGDVLYQERVDDKVPFDFKLQPNGLLSYGLLYEYFAFTGGGYTDFYVMDTTFSVIDEFQMGNGYIADFHDFRYLPNGHAILFGYDFQPYDMSEVVEDGRPDAMVAGSIIQELDADKNVVFQWRSWDYFDLADSYNDLTLKNFDAIHINAVDISSDGNLVVSVLALGEVTKINRQTGEIMWRLGGKNNEFTFVGESETYAPLYFMFQHDVRCLDNGHITMFDNGATQFNRTYSRVVEYALDEEAKTATKVWEYRHDPDIFVPTMGNAQRLPNGNTLVCWGFASLADGLAATEVDADGNVVMEIHFEVPEGEAGFGSYRAFRFPYNYGRPVADVIVYEVQEGNTYEYETAGGDTMLTITFLEKPEFGYNETWAIQYDYGPFEPKFPELAPLVLPMRYVLDRFAINVVYMELVFDVDYLGIDNPEDIVIYHREYEGRNMFFPLPTTYNPVTRELKTRSRKFGEYIFTIPAEPADMQPPIISGPEQGEDVNENLEQELAWSARGYANYYDVQVATDSLFSDIVLQESDLMECRLTLTALDPGTRYYWRVRASTDLDTSGWTGSWFETVPPFVRITEPGTGDGWMAGIKHFIEWEDNIGEDVVLTLFRDGQALSLIDTVKSIGAYYWEVPYDLELGTGYQIAIQSVSDAQVSDLGDLFEITDSEEQPEPEVTAYKLYQNRPNPVSASTTIPYDLPAESHVRFELVNVIGQRVAVLMDAWIGKGQKSLDWRVGSCASGVYFIKMTARPLDGSGKTYKGIKKMVVIK
ncbi:aryl-sulfate sulfotransferase [bacterium]|nr:aryl-sulfate sulfotransferase [bacterium]